jgi:hypothetical protein
MCMEPVEEYSIEASRANPAQVNSSVIRIEKKILFGLTRRIGRLADMGGGSLDHRPNTVYPAEE